MPQSRVRIWWDKDLQGYYLEVPFNKAFLEGFKMVVPSSDRAHDFSRHVWTFTERYLPVVKVAAERCFPGQVLIITKEQQQNAAAPAAIRQKSLDEVLLEFTKLLPPAALQRAYRAAAAELHPDHGGSMEKMSLLNSLWQRIETEHIKN